MAVVTSGANTFCVGGRPSAQRRPQASRAARNAATLLCTATEHISLAYHENAIPVIREIVVENPSDQDLVDLRVRILIETSHPRGAGSGQYQRPKARSGTELEGEAPVTPRGEPGVGAGRQRRAAN